MPKITRLQNWDFTEVCGTPEPLREGCPKPNPREGPRGSSSIPWGVSAPSQAMQACILPSTHLCEAIQHVLPGDAHVVQFEEAIIRVFKVHLGPNVPNGDP